MSKYGEPWTLNKPVCGMRTIMACSRMPIQTDNEENKERIVSCVNAMANVESPTEFMADLTATLQDCAAFVRERTRDCQPPDQFAHDVGEMISAMLARLEPAGNQGRIEEPR